MRKENESGVEFRQRILDQVSPTFCAAKWLNASIWLSSGQTASCHHPPPHHIRPEDIENNPSGIHNTFHKKLMRAQMLSGQKPKECDYCWKIEGMGKEFVSDRVHKSDFYSDEELLAIKQKSFMDNTMPRTLEIAFDRVCNFACAYCSSGYSTRWSADIKQNGGYRGLKSDAAGSYTNTGDWAESYKDPQNSPFVEAFFKWWPELAQNLYEIKITGGEPTSSPHFWRWLDLLQKSQPRPEMLVSFNSNLGFSDEMREKLFSKLTHIPRLGVYTSCEALGRTAEYIRDGLKFDQFEKNLRAFLDSGKFERVVIMATINNLSLMSFTEFMDWVIDMKIQYGPWRPHASITILRWPGFLSALTLPEDIRLREKEKIQKWLRSERAQKYLVDPEKETTQRLISYLSEIESSHEKVSDYYLRGHDLKTFLVQYDQRRGKSYHQSLPQDIVQWVEGLPLGDLSQPAQLHDGNVANWYHNAQELNQLSKSFGQAEVFR